jgi:hypothetical protein
MTMAILKMQKTIQDSVDEGYVSDPMKCAEVICSRAAKVFGDKLKEQNVKDIAGANWFVGMSLKYDSVFIGFRGRFFDTHINVELVDIGLESFYYVLVTDEAKIAEYEKIKKRHERSGEGPAMDYAWKQAELVN